MALNLPSSLTSNSLQLSGTSPRRYGFIAAAVFLVLLVGFVPPLISAIVLVVIVTGVLFLKWPMLPLYLLVFSVPYESLHELSVGGLNATATEFIAFFGGLTFLLWSAVNRSTNLRGAWWCWPLVLFGATMVVSMPGATDLKYSIKEVLKLAEMLLTYFLVIAYVDSPAKLRRLLWCIALAAASQALLGLVQAVAHFGPASFERGALLRASGTFDQPNPFAGYLNFTLPLLLAALLMGVPVAGRFTRVIFLLLFVAILLSVSRGALLASLTAALVISLVAVGRSRPLLATGAIGLYGIVTGAVFGVVPSSVTNGIIEALGLSNVDVLHPTPLTWSVAERLAHVLAGIHMFNEHPWFGVGIGNYQVVYPKYRLINHHLNIKDPNADLWVNSLGHAHNYYVNIAAETGIVGASAFIILLLSAFFIVIYLYRHAQSRLARAVALGSLGVLITVVVQSFFDNVFVHAMEAQLAIVIGLSSAAYRLAAKDQGGDLAHD